MSESSTENNQESVLFVDDEAHILSAIRRLVRPLSIQAHFANSGAEGLAILEQHPIDLVVSDMRMPEMNGAEFLTRVRERWPDTVRMLLTGYADISSTIKALNDGGIYRYISKPWDDEELKGIVLEGIRLKRLEREKAELLALTSRQNAELQDLNRNLERKVEERTEEIRQTSAMLDLAYAELKGSYDSFMRVFSGFVNAREAMKKAESKQVADLARDMASTLKLKEDQIQAVYHAALLHQIGKTGFSDTLLNTPEDELSEAERALFEQYPLIGETMLSTVSGFEKTAVLIRNHMEAYDGSGFPDRLDHAHIRAGARIIRVARDFIGLQTGLVSRRRLTAEDACRLITKQSERIYDPVAVKALSLLSANYDVSSQYNDEQLIETHRMRAGMVLNRDLVNGSGLLLISEGHTLTASLIEKILRLEKLEESKFNIYVKKA